MLPALAIRKLRGNLDTLSDRVQPKRRSSFVDLLPLPPAARAVWGPLHPSAKIATLATSIGLVYALGSAVHSIFGPVAKLLGVSLPQAGDLPVLGPVFRMLNIEFQEAGFKADTLGDFSIPEIPVTPYRSDQSKILTPTATPKVSVSGLGQTVAKEESNNDPGRVSSGKGDYGGVSYGLYQFASKIGVADAYARQSRYASEFSGLRAGSPEFSAVWRRIASREPKAFAADQQEYAEATYFEPVRATVQRVGGFDLRKRSAGLQEAVFGTSIQYGQGYASKVFASAIRSGASTDKEIIQYVQSYKANNVASNFRSSSQAVRDSIAKRIQRDLNTYTVLTDKGYTADSPAVAQAPAQPKAITPSPTVVPSRTAVPTVASEPPPVKAKVRPAPSQPKPEPAPAGTSGANSHTSTQVRHQNSDTLSNMFRSDNGLILTY